jgi:hypothetical protein
MVEFSLLTGLAIGPTVGLLATLAMDLVMARLPEGETPPKVAASVLTGESVDTAPARLATWVHYVAGAGSGLLFVGIAAAFGSVLDGSVATLTAASVVQLTLMVGFFAFVPLPRATGVPLDRRARVRRAWAIEATAYVLVAALVVAAVGRVV